MNKLFLSNFVGPKSSQCSVLFTPKEAAFLALLLLYWIGSQVSNVMSRNGGLNQIC